MLCFLPSTNYPLYDFDLRATHARTLLPAALASVSFGFVLVRVRVRVRKMVAVGHLVHKYDEIICSVHRGGHPASQHDPPVGGPWRGSFAKTTGGISQAQSQSNSIVRNCSLLPLSLLFLGTNLGLKFLIYDFQLSLKKARSQLGLRVQ